MLWGSKAGLAIGLALAPATGGASAIIIPAVTTLLGSIIGISAGKGVTNWFKGRHLRAAVEYLSTVAADFRNKFLERFQILARGVQTFYNLKKRRCRFARLDAQGWFRRNFFPSPIVKFYSMAIL